MGLRASHRDRRPSPGFPLIVYGHGFTSMRSEGAYLARHFASHGYIVVAPDFPLTNIASPGGPRFDDVVHQPGDMSFLIDELLGWNRDPGHDFSDAVDEDRIGAMGLSLGGMTTTLAAFHPRLRDPRIGAAVSIAGPSAMFTPSFFETADVPYLMIAGDADGNVGYDANAASVPARAPGARLVTLQGGSHAGFAEIARYVFRWIGNPDTLACRALAGAPADTGEGEGLAVAGLGDVEDGVDQSLGDTPCQRLSTERAMRPATTADAHDPGSLRLLPEPVRRGCEHAASRRDVSRRESGKREPRRLGRGVVARSASPLTDGYRRPLRHSGSAKTNSVFPALGRWSGFRSASPAVLSEYPVLTATYWRPSTA